MDRTEHLLTILSEECAEVTQCVTKSLRFGLEEKQPGQIFTNRSRLQGEVNDLVAIIEMLISEGELEPLSFVEKEAKKARVERHLIYSRECGRLE